MKDLTRRMRNRVTRFHGDLIRMKNESIVSTRRRAGMTACAAALVSLLLGVSSFASPLGSVVSYAQNGQTVEFTMSSGMMNITICNPHIIRIWCTPGTTFGNKDFTTITKASWNSVTYTVTEPTGQVQIATSALTVSVAKSNGTVVFKDLLGNVVAQDSGINMGASTGGTKFTDAPYSFSTPFIMDNGEAIYGLGQYEHDSSITYNGRNVTTYPQQYTSVYTVPLAVSSKGYGILWDNSLWSVQWQQNSRIMNVGADCSPYLDYYFIYGPVIDSVIAGYRQATGNAPMFGKWAYGYIQSKCQFGSQAEILNIAHEFRSKNIPIDMIVQDWNWGTICVSHFFNSNYPNPTAMCDSIHKLNEHCMLSVWPAFGTGSANYDELNGAGCLLASDFDGMYFDPFNPVCDSIYSRQIINDIMPKGFDALWHDATEGSMYQTLDWRCPAYATMQCKATYNARRQYNPNQRVYTLTRSGWAGLQHYAATVWSGDIDSAWSTFRKEIPGGLNYCLSGIPYWCDDIGGYWTNCDSEKMARWFAFGAFCPMFRVHGCADKEPWTYDATTVPILLNYLALRYRLLPYIYSLAGMVTNQGYTIMRALVMDFPSDVNVRHICSQYMFGPAFMVNPVTSPGVTTRQVYLPATTWYDFWTGSSIAGGTTITAPAPLQTIPLYIRAGSIVPMGPDLQYATQKPADTIELRVYPGANGSFSLYEDENDNYNYEKGKFTNIPFSWNDASQTLTIGAIQGSFTGMLTSRVFNVVIVGANHGTGEGHTASPDARVTYTGAQVSVKNGQVNGATQLIIPVQTIRLAYVKNGELRVVAPAVEKWEAQVYDLRGRIAFDNRGTGSQTIKLSRRLSREIYLLSVQFLGSNSATLKATILP